MSTQSVPYYTPDEYLEIERSSTERHEYIGGRIFAMGGASPKHALIVSNVVRDLGNQLLDRPCVVFSNDLRVCAEAQGPFTHPDIVVVCGQIHYADDRRDTLTNPQLIVEVLSDSTKNYDRGEKFEYYRRIRSFVEYLLIAQDRFHVGHYVHQEDGTWLFSETDDPSASIMLTSISCTVILRAIYAKAELLND